MKNIKKNKFCLPILGLRELTRVLQSRPILKKKSQKSLYFFCFKRRKKVLLKKSYTLSFSILGTRDSTRALQYSPFQNPGGVPRSWRSPNGRTEILVSNIGLKNKDDLTWKKRRKKIVCLFTYAGPMSKLVEPNQMILAFW